MNKYIGIIFIIVIMFSACSLKTGPDTDTFETTSDLQYNESSDFETAVMNKKTELDKTDAPFGVYGVFRGTDFDYNSDGTDDRVVAYGLYSQFQFVVFDGKNNAILLEERIVTHFESDNLITELYADNNGDYALNFKNRVQVAAVSELTETVQIVKENETVILEAVFDKESREYLHSYDKYDTYEDYVSEQKKCLDGYTYLFEIVWEDECFIDNKTEWK